MNRFPRLLTLPVLAAALAITAAGCDANEPEEGDEPETINRVELAFTKDGGKPVRAIATVTGTKITYQAVTLSANSTYTGSITFLNGSTDVTPEVRAEGTSHAVFYTPSNLNISVDRSDRDAENAPLGLTFTAQTGDARAGTLRVELVHFDNKVKTITAPDATYERDFSGTFPITIQ